MGLLSKIGNPVLDHAVQVLKRASRKAKAPIWLAAAEDLLRSRSRQREVNIGKISRLTKKGDAVLVPGKVLGGGLLSHPVVVGAYSFSQTAATKIQKARGKTFHIPEFIEKYPDGKGVKLLGG